VGTCISAPFGPQMALAYRLGSITFHRAQIFQGPTPSHLPS
jgi:hypothetical protein